MTANRLKLNSGKTEALDIGTRQRVTSFTSTDLQLADATVHFSQTVKSLGVYLDSTLSIQAHISFIIKTCFFHLHLIAAIRRYLTREPCAKIVISFIFSCFEGKSVSENGRERRKTRDKPVKVGGREGKSFGENDRKSV
jgi:hypothetical protein